MEQGWGSTLSKNKIEFFCTENKFIFWKTTGSQPQEEAGDSWGDAAPASHPPGL